MEEEILTIEEDAIFSGVRTVNGLTGDVPLKTINGQEVTGEGDIEIEGGDGKVKSVNNVEPDEDGNVELTAATIGAQATLDQAQLNAVNSGIDSAKVEQIATNTSAIAGKQDALNTAQLTAVNSGIDSAKVAQIATNAGDIDTIEGKIPAQATSSNQLADKAFVNSSVATNTANFVGTFNSLAELEAVQNPTNNDYGFVISTQSDNTVYNRYKFNGTAWVFEYALNNSSFTAEQWAAIQSGITSGDVTKLGGIEAGAEVNDIDSISLNGTALTPDANKNVDIQVPTPPTVVQTTGTSTTDVMSQNAVTEIIGDIESALQTINNGGND